jgi:hypothetical protein
MLASLALAVTLSAAPLADVWPYAVKHGADGTLEYSFDLSALKASRGTADAVEAHGAEAVAEFLKALPKAAAVRVVGVPGLDAAAGRGLEWGAMATSFAQVGDGPYTSDNPLARRRSTRLRQPLDPEEPKVLAPVDFIALQVRQVEDAALLGVGLDTDRLRRQLLGRIAELATRRLARVEGDAREGALALAARAHAVAACLDASKLKALRLPAEVWAAAEAERARLLEDPDALIAPPPWGRSAEATCAWLRQRALAQPYERSRAGTAAVLTYLLLRRDDTTVAALDQKLRERRDRYQGVPTGEPLQTWQAAGGADPEGAMDRLSEFLQSLEMEARMPPGPFALPATPFARFLAQLQGTERGAAMEELAAAVQDGRVSPAVGGGAAWPVAREAALAAFATDAKAVGFDGGWRGRLRVAFAALQGAHLDGRGAGLDVTPDRGERSALSVRLMVPPTLEVEPLPEAYARLATSLDVLVRQLSADGLSSMVGDARRWAARLRGLVVLATPGAEATGSEVADARRFLAAWRTEAGRDVRQAAAAPSSVGGERQHSAVVGVSRRELVVTYASEPAMAVVGNPRGLTAAPGEQRYLVPVLVTASTVAPATAPAVSERALKAALDGVGRDATRAEGALAEALGR